MGRMKTCHEIDPLVTPYVDGAAGADDTTTVDAHVAACPACRERTDVERAVRRLVQGRSADLSVTAPEALRVRCREAVDRSRFAAVPVSAPRPRSLVRRWASLAAGVVLAAALGVLIVRGDSGSVLAAELALDHVKCFAFAGQAVATDDPAAVARSFEAAYGWRVDVPAGLTSERLELLGARRCVYHDGAMAHIMYRHDGQPMSLYVLPQRASARHVVDTAGHQTVMWGASGRTFAVVGREAPESLERVATYVRRASLTGP